MKELAPYYFFMDCISPEALRAQRLAELNDLAEWRQRHLRQIKEWSDPEKREKKIAKAKAEEEAARKITVEMADELADAWDRDDKKPLCIKEK